MAIRLAANDEAIADGRVTWLDVAKRAAGTYREIVRQGGSAAEHATRVYADLETGRVSKATAAQYLACLLRAKRSGKNQIRSAPASRRSVRGGRVRRRPEGRSATDH